MTVIPTGSPLWERASDISTYGGSAEKRNHLGFGVIDALTDVGAEEYSRAMGDLAAAGRTVPFGTVTFLCSDSVPAAPTIERVDLMTGIQSVSYVASSAPVGFPSAVRNGNGDVTFTFSGVYLDPYSVAGQFELQHPRASVLSTSVGFAPCEKLTATTVRVRAFNSAGAALSNARIVLTICSGS